MRHDGAQRDELRNGSPKLVDWTHGSFQRLLNDAERLLVAESRPGFATRWAVTDSLVSPRRGDVRDAHR
jgi:hypothetical protein